MRVVVVTCYRPTNPWRERAWEWTRHQIEATGFESFVGDSGDEPFSLARSNNHVAALAGDWDIMVSWNADFVLSDIGSVARAVDQVNYFTFAHDRCRQLSKAETVARRFGGPAGRNWPWGVIAITRDCWETVGGFDPRFVGWGAEDQMFLRGVRVCFGSPGTVPGVCGGQWHPKPVIAATRDSQGGRLPGQWFKRGDPLLEDPYWAAQPDNNALFFEVKEHDTVDKWRQYVAARDTR